MEFISSKVQGRGILLALEWWSGPNTRVGHWKKAAGKFLDLPDNWLMFVRIELDVTSDNERAIHLYNSFGFEVEGRKKFSTIKDGKYADLILMARYNIPAQFNENK